MSAVLCPLHINTTIYNPSNRLELLMNQREITYATYEMLVTQDLPESFSFDEAFAQESVRSLGAGNRLSSILESLRAQKRLCSPLAGIALLLATYSNDGAEEIRCHECLSPGTFLLLSEPIAYQNSFFLPQFSKMEDGKFVLGRMQFQSLDTTIPANCRIIVLVP